MSTPLSNALKARNFGKKKSIYCSMYMYICTRWWIIFKKTVIFFHKFSTTVFGFFFPRGPGSEGMLHWLQLLINNSCGTCWSISEPNYAVYDVRIVTSCMYYVTLFFSRQSNRRSCCDAVIELRLLYVWNDLLSKKRWKEADGPEQTTTNSYHSEGNFVFFLSTTKW